jgi:DNA helicase-2/ATP-dependent DNA helicase PcrA
MARLVELGVPRYSILAITFTNKAAKEMKERVEAIVPDGRDVWVSTFHSACVRILRQDIEPVGFTKSFTIYDADESLKLISDCLKELNTDKEKFKPKAVAAAISDCKDNLVSPSDYERQAGTDYRAGVISGIYRLYQNKLRSANALDFDDIIARTVELFHKNPEILEKWQNRFRYIMVDEYQDTNTLQCVLIKLLSGKHGNVCVVGDDDQSIYGWRGANIRNILEFEKDFPGAAVIKLERNYRSTKTILECANSVIKNNTARSRKSLWTERESEEKAVFYHAASDFDEAAYIARRIKEATRAGGRFSDFAVIYRVNALSRIIEETFVKESIPYSLFGGVNFYERREVRDILAYLKLIVNGRDAVAFSRVVNVPKRGIGPATIAKIEEYAAESGKPVLRAAMDCADSPELARKSAPLRRFAEMIEELAAFARENGAMELIERVIAVTGYKTALTEEGTDEAADRLENLNALISKAKEYDRAAEEPSLEGFLTEVSLVSDIDLIEDSDNRVALMAIHRCKGLEFPVVFIAGAEEGLLPGYRSIISDTPKELEEERRLAYVGITRAKDKLYITAAKKREQAGRIVYNKVSRFLSEIPPDLVESEDHREAFMARKAEAAQKAGRGTAYRKDTHFAFTLPKAEEKKPAASVNFAAGDIVTHMKYGAGEVLEVRSAGADYEVTVRYEAHGVKKFMAALSGLKKKE